ncbi:16388_t:CDS:1, partial [Racocetra persica]
TRYFENMSFEDFISKFQELAINKNDGNLMTHNSNHIKFAMQIRNLLLQNNNTPFYAEISERWAVINGI